MGEVMKLEESQLYYVINLIDNKILTLETNGSYSNVKKYAVGQDSTEIEDLKYDKSRSIQSTAEVEKLNNYKNSPYYARMDFQNDKSSKDPLKAYIGKRSLVIDGNELVYDWRSPIGQQYYMKNQLKFAHDKYNYILSLRRALKIKDGQLISYSDEYDRTSKDGIKGISDPFLAEIIKEKRNEHRLTDIISTIQQNQNDIINYPAGDSFIVQGCAGSGKTMVLLHRLSFIKYNNPDLDLSRVKIITPNDNFNMFINELSGELELDKIDRYTIEQYYLHLLNQYDPDSWGKELVVVDDSAVNDKWLSHVYSDRFLKELRIEYKNYINELYGIIEDDTINEVILSAGIKFDITKSSSNGELNRNYIEFLEGILRNHNRDIEKLEKVEAEIIKLKEYKEELSDSKSAQDATYKYKKEKVIIEEKLKYIDIEIGEISQSRELTLIKRKLNFAGNNDDLQTDYNQLVEINNANKMLFHKVKEEIQKEEEIIVQKLTSYNILSNTNENNGIQNNINKIKTARQEYYAISNSVLSEIELFLLNNICEKVKLLSNKKDDLNRELSIIEREYHRNTERLRRQNQLLANKAEEYVELKKDILAENGISIISYTLTKIKDKFNYNTIYKNTFGKIISESSKTFRISNINTLNKYNLYLILQFYSLYYGKLTKNDVLINIDEGQDLAVTEYCLLERINGSSAVFNIYGDTNQLINNIGIKDWSELSQHTKVFTLNENYRNTTEITGFCNTMLDFNVSPIGISGKPIYKLSEGQILEFVSVHLSSPKEERYVIIVDSLDYDFVGRCISLGCVRNSLDEGKVALLTVLESKGLEFERVFVLDRNMTRNEKYIAYTRALSQLVIIK